jgi:hypothetical protein
MAISAWICRAKARLQRGGGFGMGSRRCGDASAGAPRLRREWRLPRHAVESRELPIDVAVGIHPLEKKRGGGSRWGPWRLSTVSTPAHPSAGPTPLRWVPILCGASLRSALGYHPKAWRFI